MLSPRSVLITGANRGIGLELVRQFLQLETPPKHVFATCRSPDKAEDLHTLANSNGAVQVLKLDVSEPDSFPGLREEVESVLQGSGLNLLINNAGIIGRDDLSSVTVQRMESLYRTNTIGPLFLAKEFLPLIQKAAKAASNQPMSCTKAAIVNMTSKVGSMEDNGSGGRYPYRTSKAALNMVTKNLSVDLKSDDILSVSLHPGYVKTDMGGPNALITSEQSVQGMMNVMAGLNEDTNGLMIDYAGKIIPW
ncbi:C-signal-like [Ylistrum balloti]|uniref:C-signal-like n=1 Tax=Ylistrum balloti TaxID=509963 RepID=UPI002905F24D|nr:C-signal-like [Ylistrum balloti]